MKRKNNFRVKTSSDVFNFFKNETQVSDENIVFSSVQGFCAQTWKYRWLRHPFTEPPIHSTQTLISLRILVKKRVSVVVFVLSFVNVRPIKLFNGLLFDYNIIENLFSVRLIKVKLFSIIHQFFEWSLHWISLEKWQYVW